MLNTVSYIYWPFNFWELFMHFSFPFFRLALLFWWRSNFFQLFIYSYYKSSVWGLAGNNFSHSLDSVFILLVISFAVQNLFNVMWSCLLIHDVISCKVGLLFKVLVYGQIFKSFICYIPSCEEFINICIFNYLNFSLVYCEKYTSRFNLLELGIYLRAIRAY